MVTETKTEKVEFEKQMGLGGGSERMVDVSHKRMELSAFQGVGEIRVHEGGKKIDLIGVNVGDVLGETKSGRDRYATLGGVLLAKDGSRCRFSLGIDAATDKSKAAKSVTRKGNKAERLQNKLAELSGMLTEGTDE